MSENIPKVSVVMPTYRPDEAFFREAIRSILAQTFTDFELIICDDASPESPEAVVSSFSDPRIRFFRNETNLGIAGNTNHLWNLARGEYIANMDHDDVALPCRLAKTVAYLDAHPEISAVGGAMEYFPKYKLWRGAAHPRFLDLVQGCPFAHSTLLFRKADWQKYDLKYDPGFRAAMDYERWTRALKVLQMDNLPDVLLRYRWYEENTSKTSGERQSMEYVEIRKRIWDFLTFDPRSRKVLSLLDTKKLSFWERLFYIRNDGAYKKVNVCGLHFRFLRKKKS